MFHWLKKRLFTWVEDCQRREITRRHQKAMRLKEEIERTTGKPIRLTREQRQLLAEKAKNIDPETLEQISVFDPEDLNLSEFDIDSPENR